MAMKPQLTHVQRHCYNLLYPAVSQAREQPHVARLTDFPTKSQLECPESGQTSFCITYYVSVNCPRLLAEIHHTDHVLVFQSADSRPYHGPRQFLS